MKTRDILDLIGNTPLVELTRMGFKKGIRVYGKLEGMNPVGSVKDRIARYMVEKAEESGELTPNKIILEPTSGNTGLALAMIGRRKGYSVKLVMSERAPLETQRLLQLYGAEIVFSPGEKGTNGAIEVAREMYAQNGRYYMPFQFDNEANPLAHYETTGVEILRDLPDVDVFIAGLGTGGTLMGVGKRLKETNPHVKIIAVLPYKGDEVWGLRSLEGSFVPSILDESMLDEEIPVSSKDALAATFELARKEGIFAGISSGAVIHCLAQITERMESGNVVVLLADGGWKYLSAGLCANVFEASGL